MRSVVVRAAVALLVMSSSAIAEDDKGGDDKGVLEEAEEGIQDTADSVGEKTGVKGDVTTGSQYGSAGCGLGSLLFEPSESFMQVFAATTNGLFGTQTFGITSGTSNCGNSSDSAQNVESFIVANRTALAVEAARGRGETISTLSAMAACSDDAALGRTLQGNFKTIFPSATATDQEVSHNVVTLMRKDSALGCSSLG